MAESKTAAFEKRLCDAFDETQGEGLSEKEALEAALYVADQWRDRLQELEDEDEEP